MHSYRSEPEGVADRIPQARDRIRAAELLATKKSSSPYFSAGTARDARPDGAECDERRAEKNPEQHILLEVQLKQRVRQ